MFCCSRSLVSGVQCDVEKLPHAVGVGPCHVVSAEIAVAMAVPIENPADCAVRGVIRSLQADEILGYLAEESSSLVKFFCCTAIHVCILLGRHKSCFRSNSIGTSSSILRTVRTWHRRTFDVSKNEEHLAGKRIANNEDLKKAVGGSHGMKRVYTNWCEGTTSSLMSKSDYVK